MAAPTRMHAMQDDTALHLETRPIHFKKILAATDFSLQARVALRIAARLAKQFQSRLYVLYVKPMQVYEGVFGVQEQELQMLDMERARKELHAYVGRVPEVQAIRYEEMVLCGPATDVIGDIVEKKGIDLVVVGSHGRTGLKKLALGSVAEAVVRSLHRPVLITGPCCGRNHDALRSIVLATDIPAGSLRAVQYATSLASESGAALTIMHVLPAPAEEMQTSGMGTEQSLEKALRELVPHRLDSEKRVKIQIATGNRAEEIVNQARQDGADLIVMGVREHSALADHAPWATLSEVIQRSRCPVLAVQPHLG
jgi:nucleotide-binding universal stress UspA family protein